MKDNKNTVFKGIYSKKTILKIQNKIDLLGIKCKYDAITFLNLRLFSSIILFIIILIAFDYGYILSIIFVVLYYYLFEKVFLDAKIKKRIKKLNSEAIYFFEVLTLSLQTGRNLAEAVSITVNSIDSDLSNEFKEALREVKFGKSLTESLNDMQKNIPSDSINNIILTLTQANMYGSSIIDTMYNQVDYLREKRKMEVKAAISKVPTKISIISVFFFIPLILLIILGPAILTYIGR
ncbi:MAG: type II secretion system F family protein [Bacilli bacterium]